MLAESTRRSPRWSCMSASKLTTLVRFACLPVLCLVVLFVCVQMRACHSVCLRARLCGSFWRSLSVSVSLSLLLRLSLSLSLCVRVCAALCVCFECACVSLSLIFPSSLIKLTPNFPTHTVGDSDGIYKGKRYFKCLEKHGLVVPLSSVMEVVNARVRTTASSFFSLFHSLVCVLFALSSGLFHLLVCVCSTSRLSLCFFTHSISLFSK